MSALREPANDDTAEPGGINKERLNHALETIQTGIRNYGNRKTVPPGEKKVFREHLIAEVVRVCTQFPDTREEILGYFKIPILTKKVGLHKEEARELRSEVRHALIAQGLLKSESPEEARTGLIDTVRGLTDRIIGSRTSRPDRQSSVIS